MSDVNLNKFGGALLFILGEFAAADAEMIEDGGMEVFGEDDQGREGSCEVSINDLAQAASHEINHLTEQLAEANERADKAERAEKIATLAAQDMNLEKSIALEKVQKLEKTLGNCADGLAKANERVAKLECENINGNAAAELLIWWAQKLNNAPNEDLKEVIRIGYKRIVNLANLIGEEQLRKEQE